MAETLFADEIAAIVKIYVDGPPMFSPGSAASGSATEDRAVERWKTELAERTRRALNRSDANAAGTNVALAIFQTIEFVGSLATRVE